MEKKRIKIKYVDFWPHWDSKDNFITNTLRKEFEVQISSEPDYIFFSNFNKFLSHMDYNNCVKIFYTQENICPDFNFADYGIGFEHIDFGDRYYRYPIYLIEERYKAAWHLMQKKHEVENGESHNLTDRSFCSFVVSNDKANKIRSEIFEKLNKYKKVDSGGKYMNNVGMPHGVSNKLEFDELHKFSICFENSSHPGYTTEKLIESFAAKTIPIYWGDPHIDNIFNENSFVNVSKFLSVNEAIEKVVEIDQDEHLYLEMLKTPAIKETSKDEWVRQQSGFEQFLFNIFQQEYTDAFRRNRDFWGKIYTNNIKKMRNCYNMCFNNLIMRLINSIIDITKDIKNK